MQVQVLSGAIGQAHVCLSYHPFDGNGLTFFSTLPEWHYQPQFIQENSMAKGDAKSSAVATAPEAPEETPVTTEQPTEAAPAPAEAPAEAPEEPAAAKAEPTLGELIDNAPAGAVESVTTKMPKEVAALSQERKRVAVKLGGMMALVKELRPAIWALLNTDGRNMKQEEVNFMNHLVKSSYSIQELSSDGVQVLCGNIKEED